MRLVPGGKLRVLDFDTENRPLSYLGSDFTTSDVTAIAAGFTPDDVKVWTLTKDDRSRFRMLKGFAEMFAKADIVTGHYILHHDLPILNGAMIEAGLPPLPPKLAHDTKVHLIGFKGISKSQENLAETFGLDAPKVQMNTPKWREANRLSKDGVELSVERVRGDVIQHIELRNALLERGLLKPPVRWGHR